MGRSEDEKIRLNKIKNSSENIRLSMTRKVFEFYCEPGVQGDLHEEVQRLLTTTARLEWGEGTEVQFGPGKRAAVVKGRMRQEL